MRGRSEEERVWSHFKVKNINEMLSKEVWRLLVGWLVLVVLVVVYSHRQVSAAVGNEAPQIVPNVVHQTYDYQSPSFFLFLSIMCVQRFLKPDKHILYVNDEGRYRKAHWESWQRNARSAAGTWENEFYNMIQNGTLTIKLVTYPLHPDGQPSLVATNKAHRSDLFRMKVLYQQGGIYLDTDAFPIRPMKELLHHNFTITFDNYIDANASKPRRMNNGVLLAAPHSRYLYLWQQRYQTYNPASFDYDSSVVPYQLAINYPDLVHVEMNRLSPISYGLQTSLAAAALTCGIFSPPNKLFPDVDFNNERQRSLLRLAGEGGGIWYPHYSFVNKIYSYDHTLPDRYMFNELRKKLVLHLTMSQVRGICMLRKSLSGPTDLEFMPSLLGHIFRIAYYGFDKYDYKTALEASVVEKDKLWKNCRHHFGMHSVPDQYDKSRQQYTYI